MHFRIADTFTDSLARLTGTEQKAVKTKAFDLQLNPAKPGMRFHRLGAIRDPNFWSVRVNRDIRIIVHRSTKSLLLCYVDHHDKAYQWAQRRKLETHPKTGAAQLVELRETVREILVPGYGVKEDAVAAYAVRDEPPPAKPALLKNISGDDLLRFGVPADWLDDIRQADEDGLLELADRLPGEAAEAVLELATGGKPQLPAIAAQDTDPFEHPDADRRFRTIEDSDQLTRALDYPWEKWAVFLHPEQREIVEKDFSGPARISGSAGTGKTIVALHRAVYLARKHKDARVLLTTFSKVLASALRKRLPKLISNEPRLAERLEIHSIGAIGKRLYAAHAARVEIASLELVREILTEAARESGEQDLSLRWLFGEWEEVVDAWQLQSWEDYRDIKRLGRKTSLPLERRAALWEVFELAKQRLREKGLVTHHEMFTVLSQDLKTRRRSPFDFTIVDEAQDLTVAQLRFLAALGGARPNALFFAGDLGQRIFQTPFSWRSIGVDVRGRSLTLRINYRTSHQIRKQVERLLGPEVSDVDGIIQSRRGTVSTFSGPRPNISVFESLEQEVKATGMWIAQGIADGMAPEEICILVRSKAQLDRAVSAAEESKIPAKVLDTQLEVSTGQISVSTIHLAKGMEFRAVVVMACDDEVIPLQQRIETVADDADLREVYDTERHLLYVACTRARDHLLVTGVAPASEFLDDLRERA